MPSRSSPAEPGLLIHAASGAAWVGYWSGTQMLRCVQGALKRGGARELPGLIEAVTEELPDPRWIRVCQGPGSFTGIRVGLAFARGFARGRGIPWAGFGTLEALAWAGAKGGEPITVAVDALRGEALAATYRKQGSGLLEVAAPRLIAWEDLAKGPVPLVEEGGGRGEIEVKELPGSQVLQGGATLPEILVSEPPEPRWSRPSYAEEAGSPAPARGSLGAPERE